MAYLSPPVGPPVPPPPKTANYTVTAADDGVPIHFNCTAGALSVTLPDPTTVAGRTFIVIKTDNSVNALTINGMINGMPSTSLADQYSSIIVMASNGVYTIVSVTSI